MFEPIVHCSGQTATVALLLARQSRLSDAVNADKLALQLINCVCAPTVFINSSQRNWCSAAETAATVFMLVDADYDCE